jgi:YD repeat-containing protein
LFFLSLNNATTAVIDDSGITFSAESTIASVDAALQAVNQELQTLPPALDLSDELVKLIDAATLADCCSALVSQVAELQKQIDALSVQPRLELLPSIGITFETVSKNLDAKNATFTYDMSGNLITITYANGIVKTLNYTLGILTSIVLSGSIPSGILTTKTLTYDMSGNLTNTAYT